MDDRWPRIVIHADMDAFYAAVEQRDNPSLRGKPVLIGPNGYRGVVLTASYEARPYGVGSAMSVAEARRRCPQAIMVEPHFDHYVAVSKQIMEIFGEFSPRVEALSLDEAFIEMTGAEHFFGSPQEMGRKIREAVKRETALNISVGVSGTKYVAKVASDYGKPDGLTIVPQEEAADWLAPLPIQRLWGVGVKTAPRLRALGFVTIGDIASAGREFLERRLGMAGAHFFELANARDPRRVQRGREARSVGSDRTLRKDVSTRAEIEVHLRRSAERIARRLRAKSYVARGIRVRLKSTDFQLHTRQRLLTKPADTAYEFLAVASDLLDEFDHPGPFRLVGMAAFGLYWRDGPRQLDLFQDSRRRDLETAIDALSERFGRDAVIRARDLVHHGTVMADGINLDFLDYRDGERVSLPAQ